jgi:DNA-binding SARP family transcriptional activator
MEYRVLGPLEVRAGEGPLSLGGAKQRALLALLLLNANHVVSRDRLIDALWGDEPPETALTSLQVYVSRMRKLLPAQTLQTRPPGYMLEIEPETLDLKRFERLVAESRKTDPLRASQLLREALGLWRGPALAEFGDEPFAHAERWRLEDSHLAALEERIEADVALGRHGELTGELEALVAAHPHRERLRAQLMLALYRSGRQADALSAYRDAQAVLDELGLEPSAALKQLERQVLTHDSSLELPREQLLSAREPVPLPGPLVPASPFPFVGRANELSTLRARLERAIEGEGAFVLLSGEPGAGKTRLAGEFAREASGRGVLVCYGASDAAVKVPYQPLREWFEFLLRVCDAEALAGCLGDGESVLTRLFPAFATLTDRPEASTGDDSTDRYLIRTAVADFLRLLGGLQPLLLVAEDIHWSDAETLSLLVRLARTAPEARLLVVATFRQPGEEIAPELADALADLSRLDAVTRLALGNLSSDDVSVFVRDSTDAEASPELVAAIGELTDGTPLLLCELWRDLVAGGGVEISDARVRLVRPVAELRGSEQISELVGQRLSHLSAETNAMIEFAAVTGPRFELGLVAAAAALDRSRLTAAVAQACRSGIVEELPERVPTGRFTHELVRRAVYDRIHRVRLPELHLRVAEALERAHIGDPSRVLPELAHHFTLAAPIAGVERALEYNLRAAEAAIASMAYREATTRLSTALELGVDDPLERARVQAQLGFLYFETGRTAEAEVLLAASLNAASSLEDRALAARALVHSSSSRLYADPEVSSAEMVPIAEEAIRTFEQLGERLGLAEAEHLLGEALGREGRTEESFAALERALAHADAAGDDVVRREVIGVVARRLCDGSTPADEAIQRFEGLRSSTQNDAVLDAGIRRCLALVLAMAGRFNESREHLSASSRILDREDETSLSLSSRWHVAEAKVLAGDVAEGEQDIVAAFLSVRDARGEGYESRALRAAALLALHCCDQGRWDEAAGYISYGQDVDRFEPPRGKIYAPLRLAARARVAAQRGELAEALELARRAVNLAKGSDWLDCRARVWLALAEVQRANGQQLEADAAVAEARRLYEAKGNVAAVARLTAATPTA